MPAVSGWEGGLDRAIPDRMDTDGMPAALAAEVDLLAGRTADWTRERADVAPGVRARALVIAGEYDAARHLLGARDPGEHAVGHDLASAVWAASRVGPPGVLAALETALAFAPVGFMVVDGVPLGSTLALRGLVAAARSDLAGAASLLVAAAEEGDRRAPIWGALARLELGRVLRSSGSADAAASRALTAASTFFVAGGYRYLAGCAALLRRSPDIVAAALPGLGHLVAGPVWTVGFGVAPAVEVPAGKGLLALAHLIDNRHRSVPAVEMEAVVAGRDPDPMVDPAVALGIGGDLASVEDLRATYVDDRARSSTTKLIRRTIGRLGDAHPLLGEHLATAVTTGYGCRYEAPVGVCWRR